MRLRSPHSKYKQKKERNAAQEEIEKRIRKIASEMKYLVNPLVRSQLFKNSVHLNTDRTAIRAVRLHEKMGHGDGHVFGLHR
jgi:hypothetical protein